MFTDVASWLLDLLLLQVSLKYIWWHILASIDKHYVGPQVHSFNFKQKLGLDRMFNHDITSEAELK